MATTINSAILYPAPSWRVGFEPQLVEVDVVSPDVWTQGDCFITIVGDNVAGNTGYSRWLSDLSGEIPATLKQADTPYTFQCHINAIDNDYYAGATRLYGAITKLTLHLGYCVRDESSKPRRFTITDVRFPQV